MFLLLRPLLSGIFFAVAFPPFNLWPAAFVASYLLFRSLLHQSFAYRFVACLITALMMFSITLHWSAIYVGAIPWIILAVGESLLLLPLAFFSYERNIFSQLTFASLFTLLEVLREKFPFGGFGWARLGFTQIDGIFQQLYPLGGTTLITFLIVFFGSSLGIERRKVQLTVAALSVILVGNIYERIVDDHQRLDTVFKISAVQGGVTLGLDFNRTAQEVFHLHDATTVKFGTSVQGSAFILWPENSVDIDPFSNPKILFDLEDRARLTQTSLIIGAVLNDNGLRNASLLISGEKDPSIIRRYYKNDLAPFGEYIPLRGLAEKISPYAREVIDFQPGDRHAIFRPNGIPVAPLICFEVLDDHYVASAARDASVLAIQTNNATFGRSPEAIQQFLINRVRAYELRKPAAVASTTGITAIVDTKGKVIDSVAQFDAGVATGDVQPTRYVTLRARFPYASEILIAAVFIFSFTRRRKPWMPHVAA